MALDSVEQELFDFAWQSMPQWYRDLDRTKEELYGFAKVFGAVKKVMAYWFDMCLIAKATGRELGDTGWLDATSEAAHGPDWLQFHAEDRGTRRAAGETDAIVRARLPLAPQAITRTAILAATQTILTAAGVTGTPDMVELPRDAGCLGVRGQATGTGGTFYKTGTTMTFVPTVPFPFVPYFFELSGMVKQTTVTIASATSAGNDGTFTITGVVAKNDGDGNPSLTGITFENASGVAGDDASETWAVSRLDHHGAVMDGHGRCFVNRGYRMWHGQSVAGQQNAMGGFVVILPYGTTETIRLSIREMLRQKKAAGIFAIVERSKWT